MPQARVRAFVPVENFGEPFTTQSDGTGQFESMRLIWWFSETWLGPSLDLLSIAYSKLSCFRTFVFS